MILHKQWVRALACEGPFVQAALLVQIDFRVLTRSPTAYMAWFPAGHGLVPGGWGSLF